MQLTGREASPSNKRENVVFRSLSLDGTSGKVRATVDERMLSIESKTGHALDIKISSISRVHHHHTKLIPFAFALVGFGLIWIGTRILTYQIFKIISLTLGVSLVSGWLLTRKPTITIDTDIGDCHAITGNDASLLRLNTILLRLQKGFTIAEAQEGLEILDRDAEYPRSAILAMEPEPIEVKPSESITSFLEAELDNFMFEDKPQVPETNFLPETSIQYQQPTIVEETTPSLPSWLDRPRPNAANSQTNSLIQRGIDNVSDRRTHQDPHPMSLFNQIDQISAGNQRNNLSPLVENKSIQSESSYMSKIEAGRSPLPEPLPNFCSKDGFHIPNQELPLTNDSIPEFDAFNSPDSLLGHVDEFGEEIESIIAIARKAENQNNMNEQGNGGINENSIQNKFPRLRPKNSLSHSRLKPKSRPVNNENVGMFRNIMVPAASRVANSVREATSSISNRILSGRDTSEITSSAEELRNRSHENHQQEVEALFKNLAISNGGHLPDEKVREMEEIALRRKAISEQVEQNEVETLEEFSFGDLVDSDTNKSNSSGKEGLPRIDT